MSNQPELDQRNVDNLRMWEHKYYGAPRPSFPDAQEFADRAYFNWRLGVQCLAAKFWLRSRRPAYRVLVQPHEQKILAWRPRRET